MRNHTHYENEMRMAMHCVPSLKSAVAEVHNQIDAIESKLLVNNVRTTTKNYRQELPAVRHMINQDEFGPACFYLCHLVEELGEQINTTTIITEGLVVAYDLHRSLLELSYAARQCFFATHAYRTLNLPLDPSRIQRRALEIDSASMTAKFGPGIAVKGRPGCPIDEDNRCIWVDGLIDYDEDGIVWNDSCIPYRWDRLPYDFYKLVSISFVTDQNRNWMASLNLITSVERREIPKAAARLLATTHA